MFIAMNRFRVIRGHEDDFETAWRNRESFVAKVPGFVSFRLLRGPAQDDHTLYASHVIWRDRASFEAWTRSDAFRNAHRNAGQNKPVTLGHPEFEGFETVLSLDPDVELIG